MSLGRTRSVALTGLEGALVDVEADIAQGLPHFAVSGLPDTACLQSTDRIKAGTSNSRPRDPDADGLGGAFPD